MRVADLTTGEACGSKNLYMKTDGCFQVSISTKKL